MSGHYFLVTRDRRAGETEVKEFTDPQAAVTAYTRAEWEHSDDIFGDDPRLEIVLIGGENLAEVKRAYPHYFTEGTREQRRRRILRHLGDLATR